MSSKLFKNSENVWGFALMATDNKGKRYSMMVFVTTSVTLFIH